MNGRLAMVGFTAALANEAITGASLWQQLYFAPYAYLSAYLLVVAAAQLNRAFGLPNKGKSACWPFSVSQLNCHLPTYICFLNSLACPYQECCRCFYQMKGPHLCCSILVACSALECSTSSKAPGTYIFSMALTLGQQDAVAQSML